MIFVFWTEERGLVRTGVRFRDLGASSDTIAIVIALAPRNVEGRGMPARGPLTFSAGRPARLHRQTAGRTPASADRTAWGKAADPEDPAGRPRHEYGGD